MELKEKDIWLTRKGIDLIMSVGNHNEPPTSRPVKVKSVADAINRVRKHGHTIAMIGICPREYLGL